MPRAESTWWGRNWKWFVPAGCLALLLLCGGGGFLMFFTVKEAVEQFREMPPYVDGLRIMREDPRVIEALGEPIEEVNPFPSVNVRKSTGEPDRMVMDMDVRGPKGTGRLSSVSFSSDDVNWTFDRLEIRIGDRIINLLEDPPPTDDSEEGR